MVPFQGGKPTGKHDLGVAVHQGCHLTGLRWPESGLLQIGGMADQDGVDLVQEGGGPRLLGRGYGAEDPVECSVWPGHVSVQRDIDGETYFSHVYAPSLVKYWCSPCAEHLSRSHQLSSGGVSLRLSERSLKLKRSIF